jgi:hypothetical protein
MKKFFLLQGEKVAEGRGRMRGVPSPRQLWAEQRLVKANAICPYNPPATRRPSSRPQYVYGEKLPAFRENRR